MSASVQLFVTDGRIPCPNRGSINLDICLFCDDLVNVELDSEQPAIRCTPAPKSASAQAKTPARRRHSSERSVRSKSPIHPEVKEQVVLVSLTHPEWGIAKIREALYAEGTLISSRKIGELFKNEGMVSRTNRYEKLMRLVLNHGIEPSLHQEEVLGSYDPCFKERQLIGAYPGQHLIQTTLHVRTGAHKGLPFYIQFVIDTFSNYSFVLLHLDSPRLNSILLLHYYVFPFFRGLDLPVKRVSTLTTSLSRDNNPKLTEYLSKLDIDHTFLSEEPTLISRLHNSFWSHWSRQLSINSVSSLKSSQNQLAKLVRHFNESTVIPGFPNLGYSPQHRLDEYGRETATKGSHKSGV